MIHRLVLALLLAAAPALAHAQSRGSPRFDALTVDGSASAGSVVTPSLVLGGLTLTGVGTAAGTLAAGNDSRIVGATQNGAAAITGGSINGATIGGTMPAAAAFTTLAANALTLATPLPLSQGGCGATSASGCRTGLGLGGAALLNVGTTTGTVAAGDDSRITGALQASTAASTYAPLASPGFTGNPTAPTQAAADNSTKLATTAYADRATAIAVVRPLIASGDVTTATPAIDIAIPAGYSSIDVDLTNILLTTSAANLTMLLSSDGGATWKSDSNFTLVQHYGAQNGTTGSQQFNAANWVLMNGVGIDTIRRGHMKLNFRPGTGSDYADLLGTGGYLNSSGQRLAISIWGTYDTTTARINRIRLAPSAGNLTLSYRAWGNP